MKKIMFMVFAMLFMFCVTPSFAVLPSIAKAQQDNTTVTVDLKELDSDTSQRILKKIKEKEGGVPTVTPDKAKEWADIAKGLGEAVKELCHSLNMEMNAFIKTDAGKLLTFILIWKLFGAALLALLIRTLIWTSIIMLTIISFRYFHMRKKIEDKDGNIKYINRYDWNSDEAKTASACVHVAIIIIGAIIMSVAVL